MISFALFGADSVR